MDETGRCMNCKRKAVPGNMRCQVHININKARSQAWRDAHPLVRAQEKQEWRDEGKCELCPEHRKVEPGKKHCTECLERFRGYYHERKDEGRCIVNGCNRAAKGGVMCQQHRKENRESQRTRYAEVAA